MCFVVLIVPHFQTSFLSECIPQTHITLPSFINMQHSYIQSVFLFQTAQAMYVKSVLPNTEGGHVGNRFLMCAVLSVSISLSKSITFSKEGVGWKVRGTITRFGGHGPPMPPLGTWPWPISYPSSTIST